MSSDPLQAAPDRLRAAIEVPKSEDEADLSKCERHLKAALDTLAGLLAEAPDTGGAGKVLLATSLGLESSKGRAAPGKVAFVCQRARRLERPSVTIFYELVSQWPTLMKKD